MNAPAVFPLAAQRQPAAFRTLLNTAHRYDAGVCGADCATEAGEPGHIEVHYDGRHGVPSIQIVVTDGEVVGLAAIRAFVNACMDAEKLAMRQS